MSNGLFEDHRRRQMADARDSYRNWLAGMSAAERRKLRELGVDEAACADEVGHGTVSELEAGPDSPEPGWVEQAEAPPDIDTFADVLRERFSLGAAVAIELAHWMEHEIEQREVRYQSALCAKISGVFIDHSNPKLAAAGLAFANNFSSLNGLGSQAAFARRIRLSRAAVSKMARFWRRLLDLPDSPHMKRERACRKYSDTARQRHWRDRKANPKALQQLSKRYGPTTPLNGHATNGSAPA